MKKTIMLVLHPDGSGDSIIIYRNWWQKFWRRKEYATTGEAKRHAEKKLSRLKANEERNETIANLKKFNMQYPMTLDECYPVKLD